MVELYGKIMICAFFNVYTYKTPTFQIRLKSISDFDDNQPSIGDYDMMFHPLHSEESETMPLTEIKRKRKRNYDIQSYDTISLIDDKIDFDNCLKMDQRVLKSYFIDKNKGIVVD